MNEKISYSGKAFGEKYDKDDNLINEYAKETNRVFNLEEIENNKICMDAMMMTSAILNEDFKELLKQIIGEDFPYTTGLCKNESIGNIKHELRISYEKANKIFEKFEREMNLKYLHFKEEYYTKGRELFNKVISSGMRIKKIKTFLKDCVNLITIENNKVHVFFSNDEDLEKVCKRFNIKLEIIRIHDSSEKIIKDFYESYKKPNYLYRKKKGQKSKR